jgi:CRISPR-associated protein Cst1
MEEIIKTHWLTKKTGDPFSDLGGMVIKQLLAKEKEPDILKLIEETTKIYVNKWGGKINAFFLNSKITQPAFKPDKKISETIKYFQELTNETLPNEEGYCRILGEKTKLFSCGRDNSILSGSGTFINFHPAFQYGLMLSKEAIIRLFFVPFGALQLSDKVAVLQSNDEEINDYFVSENIKANQLKLATGLVAGVNKSDSRNPSSALFDFALYWIMNSEDYGEEENIELNLYHFTNFGASPEVVLYNFSASLYTFYKKVQHRELQDDWRKFANSYFRTKGSEYQYDTGDFKVTEKKESRIEEYKNFRNWYNPLYENLIKGDPILGHFKNWLFKKRRPLNFKIVKHYQKYIRNMNDNTLKIIEKIADYALLDVNSAKKTVTNLRKPTKAFEFRTALLDLERKNHLQRNPESLFTLKEYALDLFPDGFFWKETQNLLLIAIYQKMHEREIWFNDADFGEDETTDVVTKINS